MAEEENNTQEKKSEEENNETGGKKEVLWSQLRVPNSKKGSNPYVPYIMMGTVAVIVVLSLLFAKFTS